MKSRTLILSVFAAALGTSIYAAGLGASLPASVPAVPGTSPAEAPKAEAKHEKSETELGAKMDEIGGAFRKLKKQITDPTKIQDSLALLSKIKQSAEDCLKLKPAMAADVPEADRPKFLADYQTKMKDFIGGVGKLTDAVKGGKLAEAGALLTDLTSQMKEAHRLFKKPDPKH